MPLWLGAGLADWYLHRRTRIEETSGSRESAIHTLLAAVGSAGVLPYAEELWRCWRAHPPASPMPKPAIPATGTLQISPEGGAVRPAQASPPG